MDEARKLKSEVSDGINAARLLDDPTFKAAFEHIESTLINKWRNAPIRDVEGHHELLLLIKATTALRKHLESVVLTGRMASTTLESKPTTRARRAR
jgi:hypothetical protein